MRNVEIAFLEVDREKKGAGKQEGLHKSVITINHKIVQKCWKYLLQFVVVKERSQMDSNWCKKYDIVHV